jgi:WD40 repeat protein
LISKPGLEHSPLQTYYGALLFAPENSIVKKQFRDELPKWFKFDPTVEQNWSSLLFEIDVHTEYLNCMAFSPDGNLLASAASDDVTVRLWNPATGDEVKRFEGHSRSVKALAFSSCGQFLATGSSDGTVILWSINSGLELRHITGHCGRVESLVFSPDDKQVISVSLGTVIIWGLETEYKIHELEHSEGYPCIA